ncbi:uncharacterized protein LOC101848352 [Aplysia californica]|uniref:Uncharacterized protein LOC101848352 n=1 Tax=Aplysia californica TaxID=6500 RepID=A0ABM0JP25_APLCA|nr:uncharacterized protein LOC101848352 [Aplysia californica]
MAKNSGLSHILTELSSLEELTSVLGRSSRLKYTCLSVSKKYIALGSNTGGVYIFSRDTLKYLQVVFGDTEASPVCQVSLSPGDQHIGVALSTGQVAVFELRIEKRAKPERVRLTHDHAGRQVKAFVWDAISSKLFVGDDTGKISIIFVPSTKTKTLFSLPSEVIVYLDSNIYQMDWWKDKLLVSTLTHTHLFDTIKHNYSTIGTKKRDGEFGSCFFLEPRSQYSVIYCARPSSRMWEVDFQGKVLNTHQFKQLLAIPPVPVVNLGRDSYECINKTYTGQSVNFLKMFRLGQFLVTWSAKGLYIFDPINVKILVWTEDVKGVQDLAVCNNDVYLFLANGSVTRLVLLPVYQLFTVLSKRCHWTLMASLLVAADQIKLRPAVVKRIKQDLLSVLTGGLREEGKSRLAEKVEALLEDVSDGSLDSLEAQSEFVDTAEIMGHTYLPTGMVVVSEGVAIDNSARPGGYNRKSDVVTAEEGDYWQEGEIEDGSHAIESGGDDVVSSGLYLPQGTEAGVGNKMDGTETNMTPSPLYSQCPDYAVVSQVLSDSDTDSHQVSVFPGSDIVDCGTTNPNLENLGDVTTTKQVEPRLDNNENVTFTPKPASAQNGEQPYLEEGEGHSEGVAALCDSASSTHSPVSAKSVVSSSEPVSPGTTRPSDVVVMAVGEEDGVKELSESQTLMEEGESLGGRKTSGEELSPISSSVSALPQADSLPLHQADIHSTLQSPGSSEVDGTIGASAGVEHTVNLGNEGENEQPYSSTGTVVGSPVEPRNTEVHENSMAWPDSRDNDNDRVAEQLQSQMSASHVSDAAAPPPSDVIPGPMLVARQKSTKKEKQSDDLSIAQPLRTSKKKKKKKNTSRDVFARSVSFDPAPHNSSELRQSASVGDDPDSMLFDQIETEFDAISMETISSIEEEEPPSTSMRVKDPDTISCVGDFEIKSRRKWSNEMALSPMENSSFRRKMSSELGLSLNEAEEVGRMEVIPPLIDRLAAARGSFGSEEALYPGREISPSLSPLTASGEHFPHSVSPRNSLSALKDGLSLKLKTQTRSFIKSIKGRNPLLTKTSSSLAKSSSSPMLSELQSPQDQKSWKADDETSAVTPDESVQTESDSESDTFQKVASAAVDVHSLSTTALRLQKRLGEWSAMVKPAILVEILTEWARELHKAMLDYHRELHRVKVERSQVRGNKAEVQEVVVDPGGEGNFSRPNSVDSVEGGALNGHDRESTYVEGSSISGGEVNASVSSRISNASEGQETSAINNLNSASIPPDALGASSDTVVFPEDYWLDVVHAFDPFPLSEEFREVFQQLTTMCFICGVHGEVLSAFGQTDLAHYIQLVQSLLPSVNLNGSSSKLLLADRVASLFSDSRNSLHASPMKDSEVGAHCETNGSSGGLGSSEVSGLSGADVSGMDSPSQNVCSQHEKVTEISRAISSEKQFSADLSQAVFLRLYFFLLDFEAVKRELDQKETGDWLLTWAACLQCSQAKGAGDIVSSILAGKQVNSAFDYLRSGILPHHSALLGHAYRLFSMSPGKVSEFCAERKKHLTAMDLLCFCLHASRPMGPCLLRYTRQMMTDLAPVLRPAALRQMCSSRQVRRVLMEELIPTLTQDSVLSSSLEGSKSLAGQLTAVLSFDWLNLMLSLIESEEEIEQTLALCTRSRCWCVCVKLLKRRGDWCRLLTLVLKADDVAMLNDSEDGYLPRNLEEWRFLLQEFQRKSILKPQDNSKLESENGSSITENFGKNNQFYSESQPELAVSDSSLTAVKQGCTNNVEESFHGVEQEDNPGAITWNNLGYLLLTHLGGALAIELLTEYLDNPEVSATCLRAEFLSACYADYSIKMEQHHLSHEMLEKMSMYMWAKKPGFVTPSVYHTVRVERRSVETGEGHDMKVQGMCAQVQGMSSQDLMAEYLPGHWGQEVNIYGPCPCCNLPLKSVVSLSSPGVAVFPCGHACHKRCAPQSVCPLDHPSVTAANG